MSHRYRHSLRDKSAVEEAAERYSEKQVGNMADCIRSRDMTGFVERCVAYVVVAVKAWKAARDRRELLDRLGAADDAAPAPRLMYGGIRGLINDGVAAMMAMRQQMQQQQQRTIPIYVGDGDGGGSIRWFGRGLGRGYTQRSAQVRPVPQPQRGRQHSGPSL
ncbi:MAG: hypothetical protein IJ087_11505 [Eggerthellaceae bacterium]|nr:hypothetical protein [Eggerthellaceae bacterium]